MTTWEINVPHEIPRIWPTHTIIILTKVICKTRQTDRNTHARTRAHTHTAPLPNKKWRLNLRVYWILFLDELNTTTRWHWSLSSSFYFQNSLWEKQLRGYHKFSESVTCSSDVVQGIRHLDSLFQVPGNLPSINEHTANSAWRNLTLSRRVSSMIPWRASCK